MKHILPKSFRIPVNMFCLFSVAAGLWGLIEYLRWRGYTPEIGLVVLEVTVAFIAFVFIAVMGVAVMYSVNKRTPDA